MLILQKLWVNANHRHLILLSWILCSYVEFCELVCFLLGFSQSDFPPSLEFFPLFFPPGGCWASS